MPKKEKRTVKENRDEEENSNPLPWKAVTHRTANFLYILLLRS